MNMGWYSQHVLPGNTQKNGRLSMVNFLIKIACFVKKKIYTFSAKSSLTALVSARRSIVLILPFSKNSLLSLWHCKMIIKSLRVNHKVILRSV